MAEQRKRVDNRRQKNTKASAVSVIFVRFENSTDFGTFCVLLREGGVHFGLRGHQTVALTHDQLHSLPRDANDFLELCERTLRVKVELEPASTGERSLPTEEEVREALKERIAEFDKLARKN
jgi:hypothetical protein